MSVPCLRCVTCGVVISESESEWFSLRRCPLCDGTELVEGKFVELPFQIPGQLELVAVAAGPSVCSLV